MCISHLLAAPVDKAVAATETAATVSVTARNSAEPSVEATTAVDDSAIATARADGAVDNNLLAACVDETAVPEALTVAADRTAVPKALTVAADRNAVSEPLTVAHASNRTEPMEVSSVAIGEQHSKSVEQKQQELCGFLGYESSIVWDKYGEHNKEQFIQKIDLIICTDDSNESDNGASTSSNNSTTVRASENLERLRTMKKNLIETIWNQRKYCAGSLLMSHIFIACVADADKYLQKLSDAKTSHKYTLHPVFRIFRCSRNQDSHSCCMIFVDETGRVYQNWTDYKANNQYGECVIVAPHMGIYNTNVNGNVQLETFPASCLLIGNQVVKLTDIGTSITGLLATGVMASAAVFALPAVAVAGAVGTGFGCAAYSIGRGIGKLLDRSNHEQSIDLTDRESRGVWFGIAGGLASVAAGAATKGVELAARNGQAVNTLVRGGVNTLNITAMTVNGMGVADGFFNVYMAYNDGDEISALDVIQLGSSLFLFTHSVNNFRTAEHIYTTAQQKTMLDFKQSLSKNQQKTFAKMYKETLRVSGRDAGTRDVIKSLRNIPDHKSYFRDLNKINKSLNKNNVKISFDGSDKALLNNKVAVTPSELRANLRQLPPDVVFADVPTGAQPNFTGASTSTAVFGEGGYGSPRIGGSTSPQSITTSSATQFLGTTGLTTDCALRLGRLAFQFYTNNRALIAEKCQIHFDERFVDDIRRIVGFLAEQAHQSIGDYLFRLTADYLSGRILGVFNNRYLQQTLHLIGDQIHVYYEQIVDGLRHIRSRIMDELGFRETILNLLEELTHVVVDKMMRIATCCYNTLLDNGLDNNYQPFENHFDDVCRVLQALASQYNFEDFSCYIMLIENIDLEEIHLNVSAFYNNLRTSRQSSRDTVHKCTVCDGTYTVSPLD